MASSQSLAPGQTDIEICKRILAEGSKSFDAAARILPEHVRGAASVFYAFCRVADDAVDESADPAAAVAMLRGRLDRIYAGSPDPNAVDRALEVVVSDHRVPRHLFDALLEGFQWDAEGRVYESLSDVLDYSARVAAAVGVVMSILMGVREPQALARACDMGGAMQLTNIARDVGEDAARGRLYLPRRWLAEEGVDADEFLRAPRFEPALGRVVERLLAQAEKLYARGDAGVSYLPADSRPSIRAARLIYSDIGRVIANADYDSVGRRAFVTRWRKLWLLIRAYLYWTRRATVDVEIQPEFRFLLDAASENSGALTAGPP